MATAPEELIFNGKAYISAKNAAEISGYAQDYIGQLARGGSLPTNLVGRARFVEKEALLTYVKNQKGIIIEDLPHMKTVDGMQYEKDERPLRPELQKKTNAISATAGATKSTLPTLSPFASTGLPAIKKTLALALGLAVVFGNVLTLRSPEAHAFFYELGEKVVEASEVMVYGADNIRERVATAFTNVTSKTIAQYERGQVVIAESASAVLSFEFEKRETPQSKITQQEEAHEEMLPALPEIEIKKQIRAVVDVTDAGVTTTRSAMRKSVEGGVEILDAFADGVTQGIEKPIRFIHEGFSDTTELVIATPFTVGGYTIALGAHLAQTLAIASEEIGADLHEARLAFGRHDTSLATATPLEGLEIHRSGMVAVQETEEPSVNEEVSDTEEIEIKTEAEVEKEKSILATVSASGALLASSVTEGITVTGERITEGVISLYGFLGGGGQSVIRTYTIYTDAVDSGLQKVASAYTHVGGSLYEGFSETRGKVSMTAQSLGEKARLAGVIVKDTPQKGFAALLTGTNETVGSFVANVGDVIGGTVNTTAYNVFVSIRNIFNKGNTTLVQETNTATTSSPTQKVESVVIQTREVLIPQPITRIERIIEQVPVALAGVSQQQLEEALQNLNNSLKSEIYRIYDGTSNSNTVRTITQSIAHTNKIDQLSGVTITNATVDGVSGLTDADIPDGITASNYVPLSGASLTGNLTAPAFIATSTSVASTFAYRLGVGTTSPQVALAIDGTDALGIPVGTTVQRPSVPLAGYLRYNTTTSGFEGYSGSNWSGLGGVIDVDQDTYILAESTSGADEDALFFYTAGSERMRITAAGNVGFGTTSPYARLSVHEPATGTNTTLFAIASSTASATSTLFSVANTGATTITSGQAAAVGLTVKGATSQTGNLQEWQNSAGTVLSSIDSAGQLGIGISSSLGGELHISSSLPTIRIQDSDNNAGNNGSAYIEFGQTTGSVWERVGYVGDGTSGGKQMQISADTGNSVNVLSTIGTHFGSIADNVPDAYVSIVNPTNTTIGAIVRGATSQSANLQEWQNSAGTVLFSIDSDGDFRNGSSDRPALLNEDTTNTNPNILTDIDHEDWGLGGRNGNLVLVCEGRTCVHIDDDTSIDNAALNVGSTATNNIVVAKANASQSVPIFQVVDSANSSYLTVGSNGKTGIGTSTPFAKLSVHGLSTDTASLFAIATSTATATTTVFEIKNNGDLDVGGGALTYNYSTNKTSIERLDLGNLSFETDAGTVSWVDLPVSSSAPDGTDMSYSAQIDSLQLLTVFAEADGSGGVKNTRVYVGTTTPALLSSSNIPYGSFLVNDGIICVDDGGDNCDDAQRYRGGLYATSTTVTAIDLAEQYPTKDSDLEGGDLVMFDTVNEVFVTKFNSASSTGQSFVGVISTAPGVLLGGFANKLFEGEVQVPVVLAGRVPVKVNADGGPIRVGDRLTHSTTTPGVARRATRSGETLGIALEAWDASATSTKIVALIEPRYHFVDTQFAIDTNGNIGIGTSTPAYKLHVIGDVAATGFVNISTRDSKKDISYISESRRRSFVDTLREVRIAEYHYTNEGANESLRLGLIAEEAPSEVLSANRKGVDLYKLSTLTLGAVQTLADDMESIKRRVAELEARGSGNSGGGVSVSAVLDRLAEYGSRITNGIARFADVVIARLEIGSSSAPAGITLYDEETGDPYCVVVKGGQLINRAGVCAELGTGSVSSGTSTTTPPVMGSAPTITLIGNNPATITLGTTFIDPGAYATDTEDGPLMVDSTGTVDTETPGEYTLTYTTYDLDLNYATTTRTVLVVDPNAEESTEEETASTTPPVVEEEPEPTPEPETQPEPQSEPEPTPEPTPDPEPAPEETASTTPST